MRRLGERIRQHYDQQFYSQSEPDIIVKSSPYSRCVESAAKTLQGLDPGSKVQVQKDPVLLFTYIDPPDDFLQSYKQTYADLIAAAGVDTSVDNFMLHNVLHCDNVHNCLLIGKPIPEYVTREILDQMDDFVQSCVVSFTRIPGFLNMKVKGIVTAILNDLTSAAEQNQRSIFVLNTHDLHIDFLLLVLHVLPGGPAKQPFAATLTFELHEELESKERIIKLWYNKEVESFPGELIRTVTLTDLTREMQEL